MKIPSIRLAALAVPVLALTLAGCPAKKAPDPDPTQACIAECVQRNQMRAVTAEQIEADCAAECEGAAPAK